MCFDCLCSKQNSVIRLKSNILTHPKFFSHPPNFWTGYATASANPRKEQGERQSEDYVHRKEIKVETHTQKKEKTQDKDS